MSSDDNTNKSTDMEILDIKQHGERAALEMESHNSVAQARQDIAQNAANYSDKRDLMNQLMGQVEMARSIAKFTDVVGLTKLAYIKESKLYQTLKGKSGIDSTGAKIADVGCWDGFCRWIGTSSSKVNEDLLNLRVLGEDALDSLQRIGAGYRDLRLLRKLSPEDRDDAVSEAVSSGDKEVLLSFVDNLWRKTAASQQKDHFHA